MRFSVRKSDTVKFISEGNKAGVELIDGLRSLATTSLVSLGTSISPGAGNISSMRSTIANWESRMSSDNGKHDTSSAAMLCTDDSAPQTFKLYCPYEHVNSLRSTKSDVWQSLCAIWGLMDVRCDFQSSSR